jgi:hypothetical protein
MTVNDPTLLHDDKLKKLGTPIAKDVLARRARGASLVRVVLARMYGDPHQASAEKGWNIVPHVTDRDTIGVVNVADGTAWDSMVPADGDVLALGLDDQHTPDGNHPSLGLPVYIDGELVQEHGQAPDAPITGPKDWKRIGLPTFRGFNGGNGSALVPPSEFTAEQQIRPRLRAVGLMTCYGELGLPRTMLDDAAGHGGPGLPPWIHPTHQIPTIQGIPIPEDLASILCEQARQHLRDCIQRMVNETPLENDVRKALETDDRSKLYQVLTPARRGADADTALYCDSRHNLVLSAVSADTMLAWDVLSAIGTRQDHTGGIALTGLLLQAITYRVLERTTGARAAIFKTLVDNAEGENIFEGALAEALEPLTLIISGWSVRRGAPAGFEETLRATLFSQGPLYLDQPAEVYRPQ